jgi:hypothetical protein
MERKRLLLNISESLSRFSAEVDIVNAHGEYDINIHSENVLIPLLNELFGYKLINANTIKNNFPAVDLVDGTNKVAFQITSSANKTKFKETLTKFVRHDLHKEYDVLYIFVISTREFKFLSKSEIDEILGNKIEFDPTLNVLNHSRIYRSVSSLPIAKIKAISDVLLPEFTDTKIAYRREHINGTISTEKEALHSNLVRVEFPQILYVADLSIDKKEIRKSISNVRNKNKRRISDRDIIKEAIVTIDENEYCADWITSENKLITFKNLQDDRQFLRRIIDVGTVTPLSVDEYCTDDDKVRLFKELVRFILRERLRKINIEWFEKEKVFRFKSGKMAKETKVTWTMDKKSQPRAVIHEIWNQDPKNKHIVCFRHLAFRLSVYLFENTWYVSIAPTYSFTSNGFKKSQYSSSYMSGIKREEDNKAVYQHFRFLVEYMRKLNEATLFGSVGNEAYTFNLCEHLVFAFSPNVDDLKWNPLGEGGNTDTSNPSQLKLL